MPSAFPDHVVDENGTLRPAKLVEAGAWGTIFVLENGTMVLSLGNPSAPSALPVPAAEGNTCSPLARKQ